MGRALASGAITGGVSVIRQARSPQLQAATEELAQTSQGHDGVTIYHAYTQPHAERAQIRLLGNDNLIFRNRALLGHLTRGVVYAALEVIPDLNHDTDLTTKRGVLDNPELSGGGRLIRVGFDKASTEKLQDQYDQIGQTLMRLAVESGVYAPPLEWPPLTSDLVLARVAPGTPEEVFQALCQAAEGFDPFELQARRTRILPALNRTPA